MDFETEEILVSKLLVSALRNDNDVLALADLRGLARKLAGLGVDFNNVHISDKSVGVANEQAMKAIDKKKSFERILEQISRSVNGHLGTKPVADYSNLPTLVAKILPAQLVPKQKQERELKGNLLAAIDAAGVNGISLSDLVAVYPSKKESVTRRKNEMIREGIIFEVGDVIYHDNYKEAHKIEHSESEMIRKSKVGIKNGSKWNTGETELLAAKLFLSGASLKDIQHEIGAETEGQVKGRFYNSPPPKSLIVRTKENGTPTDWAELWFIGYSLYGGSGHGWLKSVKKELPTLGKPGTSVEFVNKKYIDKIDSLRGQVSQKVG